MVSFTVRMTFRVDDRAAIEELLQPLTRESRRELGCVSYIPHWVEQEPATLVIYEQYADQAAVEYHRTTPHFQEHAVGGLYQKMLERHVENLNAIA